MKLKYIYSALMCGLMTSTAFSTFVPLADELNTQTQPMGATLYAVTLMEIMNRDYLTMDQERYDELCRLGRDVRKTDKDRAIFYFSQAAQYGQLGAFRELGLCYSGKGEMVLAYKWWAWAVQEAYMTRVSAQNSDYKMCIQFLNHEGNKQKLRQVFQDDEKLGSFFDAWEYDFSKIDWVKNHKRVKQYEPYLSPEELDSKKNLFFHYHVASSTETLSNYYNQLEEEKKKDFFKEIKCVNNIVVHHFMSHLPYPDLTLESAQLCLKKIFDTFEKSIDFRKMIEKNIAYEIYKNLWLGIIISNDFRLNYGQEPLYNNTKMFKITKKLHKNNFNDTILLNQLSRMYFEGQGCKQDIKQAIILARQENSLQESDISHYNIGFFSMKDIDNPHIDYNDIRFHFLRAAELGDDDALVQLGFMSYYGLGCEKSVNDAVIFYKQAQDKGNIGGNAGLWEITLSYPDHDELDRPLDFTEYFSDQTTRNYLKKRNPLFLARILRTIDHNSEDAIFYYKKALTKNYSFFGSKIRAILTLIDIYRFDFKKSFDAPEILEQINAFNKILESKNNLTRLYYFSYAHYLLRDYSSALDYLNSALLAGYKDVWNFFSMIQKELDFMRETKEKAKKQEKKEIFDQEQEDRSRRKQEKQAKKQARYKEKMQARLSDFQLLDNDSNNQVQEPQPLTIHFINQDVENDFKELELTNDKIYDLLTDIAHNPWELKGTGKPERLRHKKGYYSRRLDHENRLVYRIDGPGVITIIACKGHYNKI